MKVVKIKQNTNKPFHILEKDTCQKHVQIRYDLLLLTLFQIIVDFIINNQICVNLQFTQKATTSEQNTDYQLHKK